MAQKKQEGPGGKFGRATDVVSQDRNWVIRINNQLGAQKKWGTQWGYLSGGFSPEKTGIKQNINQRIQQLQREVAQMNVDGQFSKTSDSYGKGEKMQMFDNSQFNMQKNKDLRPLQRKLPKGWKKQKWTPPVDPYDPLSKMGKKK